MTTLAVVPPLKRSLDVFLARPSIQARGVGIWLVVAAALLVLGCSGAPPTPPTRPTTATSNTNAPAVPAPPTAQSVLEEAHKAYLNAQSYADAGQVLVRFKLDGQEQKEEIPFSVAYQRPNKLRLHAYGGTVVSDGKQIVSLLEGFAGYAIVREAPLQLTLADVYSDPLLYSTLTQQVAGPPPQIPLLLASEFVDEMKKSCGEPRLLDNAELDGEVCHRVRFTLPDHDGAHMTYWISRQSKLLRRIEFPFPAELRESLAAAGKLEDAVLTAEFTGAALNGKIDAKAFTVELPTETKIVRRFITPVFPVGRKTDPFELTALDGGKLDSGSLVGRVVVMNFWTTAAAHNLRWFANLHKKFQGHEKVRVLCVSNDGDHVTSDTLMAAVNAAKVELPLYRDPQGSAAFAVGGLPKFNIPTVAVIGPDGTLEEFAYDPPPGRDQTAELTALVEALLEGKSVATERIAAWEQAMLSEEETAVKTPAAPKSHPEHCELTPLWTLDALPAELGRALMPGNIYAGTGPDGKPRILAIDGARHVLELDVAGKLLAIRDLQLPTGANVTFLRSAVDGRGQRYFLLAAPAIKDGQLFVYDAEWNLLTAYPSDPAHPGILDARLVDLNGDGRLEIAVGYDDVAGVQLASLDGKRLWSNRSLKSVFSIVEGPIGEKGQRWLWCTNATGNLAQLDFGGQRGKDIPLAFTQFIVGADLAGDGQFAYCTVSLDAQGAKVLGGFSPVAGPQWSYTLPHGALGIVEHVVPGRLLGDAVHWIAPGPDGSLHFVGLDGVLLDKFNYGAHVVGVAAVEAENQRLLIVAEENAIRAFAVRAK